MNYPPLSELDPAETARMAPIFDDSRYKTRIEMRELQERYERRIGLLKRKLAIAEQWIENELARQKLEEIELLKFRVGFANCDAEMERIEKKYAKKREAILGGEQ
jgi:hypothetical protein